MNKVKVAKELSKRTSLTHKQSEEAVSEMFRMIEQQLTSGDSFSYPGFGKFFTKVRPGRNYSLNGDTINSKDKVIIHFKPYEKLKSQVNQ